MKGASERIIDRCSRILVNGQEQPLDETKKKALFTAIDNFADRGERVLGFCYENLGSDKFPKGFDFNMEKDQSNFPLNDLVLAGLVSLMDPPRPEVPLAVKKCQSAGIKVIMVTGDFPKTACSIAKQVNIINVNQEKVPKTQWDLQKEHPELNE